MQFQETGSLCKGKFRQFRKVQSFWYRLWKSDERKVAIARDVIFYEKEMCCTEQTEVKSFEKKESVNNEYEMNENLEE